MKIWVNDKQVEVHEDETLLEICRREGFSVPSLCWVPGARHKPSCMVCMVQDETSGSMLPSCSVHPSEGMRISTSSPEVLELRKMALDLLLSDHRADCDAPCTTACPHGLDVEGVLAGYDSGDYLRARKLMAGAFGGLETLPCEDCKAPCEKVCRRNSVDTHVRIRAILSELRDMEELAVVPDPTLRESPVKGQFSSRIGQFTEKEKIRLRAREATPSLCLHCACGARKACQLRDLATLFGIRTPDFGVSSLQPFKEREQLSRRLWFDPAKCIRCGLCVYNTDDAFTFKGRGFAMQVVLPRESRGHVDDSIAGLCPTGALTLSE